MILVSNLKFRSHKGITKIIDSILTNLYFILSYLQLVRFSGNLITVLSLYFLGSSVCHAKKESTKDKLSETSATNAPIVQQEEKRDQFNLTAYNPVYFVFEPDSTKLQASFKYRLHREIDLYFAYTHLILWDLLGESRPFLDSVYNPELLYRKEFKNFRYLESWDIVPFGHASNGQSSLDSRSIDYAATQVNFKFILLKSMVLRTGLKARYMWNFDATNRNIQDYYGPFELKFALTEFRRGFLDKGELSAKIYTGGHLGQDFKKGGQELGLSFRVKGLEIVPAFFIQYFNGYNESFRYYDKKVNLFRFGLLL